MVNIKLWFLYFDMSVISCLLFIIPPEPTSLPAKKKVVTRPSSLKEVSTCNLTDDKDNPFELKKPKEIASESLQNPSDPEATYSGHKGQGYQVQVQETFCDDEQKKEETLNLILNVEVEPAHNSDANALIPAIESTQRPNLKPKELTADSLYGSDDNCERAKELGVDLIAPSMGSVDEDKLSLADFQLSDEGEVVACPQGNAPAKIKKGKKVSIGFAAHACRNCPDLSKCPVEKGKKYYYLPVTDKQIRIAKRRIYERSYMFQVRYRWRAGVEATMSEFDRRTGVKHLRVGSESSQVFGRRKNELVREGKRKELE